VRNALERARLRQASRLLDSDDAKLGKKDLMLLVPEDFTKSRMFTDDAGREFAKRTTTMPRMAVALRTVAPPRTVADRTDR